MNRRFRKKYRYSRHKSIVYLLVVLLLCGLGLGYASIKTDLSIIGTSKFINASWDVHFDNIQVREGSITPTTPATITDDTTVTFSAQLEEPGEYYVFTVDVVNEGTLDAMIGSLSIQPTLSIEEQDYFDYYVAYEDGTHIENNHKLLAGTTETLVVSFTYEVLYDTSLYPTEDKDYTISVSINYVQSDETAIDVPHPPTLYGVLENAATVGTYAAKYTGDHQDSFDGTGTKNIYYWYADTDANGTAILDKNNVIFANHCWQMIRTTDTGGVKMIYNGEPENRQCLNTRGTHIGYDSRTAQNLANDYYYGTNYEYINNTHDFKIKGDISHNTWSSANSESLIGKYTCKSTSSSGRCETIYYVESYYNTSSAYVIPIKAGSHYSQFGKIQYNIKANSPAYAGYMYNQTYPITRKNNTFKVTEVGSTSIGTNAYYSDTIDYNVTTPNKYTLLNPISTSTLPSNDYSALIGKYILNSTGTSSSIARYVTAVSGTSLSYRELTGGDLTTSLTLGDAYTESGGVYTLVTPVNVDLVTWYSNTSDYSIYKGKYVCEGNNTSCTNLKHIYNESNPTKYSFYYFDTTTTWSFAESVSYNGTSYTLSGDIKTFWDFYDGTNKTALKTHHYTCLGNGTSCTTVSYLTFLDEDVSYIQLSGTQDISTALSDMLNTSNVNTKNSIIKTAVEKWYQNNIQDYDDFIEDTIYCNNRTTASLGAWRPTGNLFTKNTDFLQFPTYNIALKEFDCNNVTDQFSTLNPSALLSSKVGLMTSPEMALLNKKTLQSTGQEYWLISPNSVNALYANNRTISSVGLSSGNVDDAKGVRPVISLKPGTIYLSGDGSMANPYYTQHLAG